MNRGLRTILVLCALPVAVGVGCFVNGGGDCTTDGDCHSGYVCTANACQPKACTADADCTSGALSACESAACVSRVCKTTYMPKGTTLPDTKKGDCQRPACDGKGGIIQVPYPSDAPASTSPCTKDACSASGHVESSFVTAETACMDNGEKGVCDGNGACVQCVKDTECTVGTSPSCYDNACVSCSDGKQDGDETGVDCGGSHCLKCNGDACMSPAQCKSGACAGTPATCFACMSDLECPPSHHCMNGTCSP